VYWEQRIFRYIDNYSGAFSRNCGLLPETVGFIVRMGYDSRFYRKGEVVAWQQVANTSFSVWDESHLADYASYMLSVIDEVHEQNCVRELYSSDSNLTGK
jgi:hypothetical protein